MNSKEIKKSIDKFIHTVQKPGRYTGNELNITVKPEAEVRIAISYPDLYEVAMSNNGIRILYDAANEIESVACERVFAVAPDFEKELRERNIPLYTLETFTPLNELDLIGFNLSHELLATNVLQILDLGGVPLLRDERADDDPIIIAGGEAVSNPFPYADFFDIFFAGDGEESFPEIINTLLACKREGVKPRSEIIRRLRNVEGVLVPGDYSFEYKGTAVNLDNAPSVKLRKYGRPYYSRSKPLVPNIRISHERAVVEVARGCFNLCKFCHAGYYNLPYRSCSDNDIAAEVLRQLDSTGYNEVTLTALSVSDYKHLVGLLNKIIPDLTERGASVSLPSLKVDRNTLPIIELISKIRKSSLTFAVESASEELRSISNKKVRTEDLLEIVDFVFKKGWRTIKFYFMIGLPGCENVDEAAEITALMKQVLDTAGKGKKEINVTISPFVPKTHTPFQWEKMMDMDYFYDVIRRVKTSLPRSVQIKNHDVKSSFLEGLIARGDTRFCRVIYHSYLDGAKLDSWQEYFRFDIWMKNLDKYFPDWGILTEKRDEALSYPWQVIETGNERAVDSMKNKNLDVKNYHQPLSRYNESPDMDKYFEAISKFEERLETAQSIRMVFSRTGHGRLVPHLDFIEILKRAFRMSGLPVSFSRGFNKREKITTGYPVPLGFESLSEVVEVDLFKQLNADELAGYQEKINLSLPLFVKLLSVREVKHGKSLMALVNAVEYHVLFSTESLARSMVNLLEEKQPLEKRGKSGIKIFLFDEAVHSWAREGKMKITIILYTGNESSFRADEFFYALSGMKEQLAEDMRIIKKCQYTAVDGKLEIVG
jgi:radical SAM family uncharacterized protein/radical SAM-linked protein